MTPTAFTPLSYPTTCTHLHMSHMHRHFTMCGNTGLWHEGVLYQVEGSNISWWTEALVLIFIPLMFFTCRIKRKKQHFLWCWIIKGAAWQLMGERSVILDLRIHGEQRGSVCFSSIRQQACSVKKGVSSAFKVFIPESATRIAWSRLFPHINK